MAMRHRIAGMTHADIIAKLGGPKPVADWLGISTPNTVTYWGRAQEGRSIPSRHWARLVTMPGAADAGITTDLLAAGMQCLAEARVA